MAADLFFLESDRHRVGLLARFLVRLGIDAVLHNGAVAPRSDTILVVCTAAASSERWLMDLLGGQPGVVALMLDRVPLPKPCMRAVDLTNWPARSADAEVAALVRWLKNPAANPVFGVAAARRFKNSPAATAGSNRDGPGPWLTAGLLVGLLAGFGLLLWSTMPGDGDGERSTPEGVDVPVAAAFQDAASGRGPVSGAASAAPITSPGTSVSSSVSASLSPALSSGIPGSHGSNDALSRLCRAPDPVSAAAWLGTLNWKQRVRLHDADCVRQLAAQPGFEAFAAKLASRPG